MGWFLLGSILGGALISLLLPVLILVAARFVGPMKRNPRIVYSICALLVVLTCALSALGSGLWGPAVISVVLALLFLWWGYSRDTRALGPPPSAAARRKGTDY